MDHDLGEPISQGSNRYQYSRGHETGTLDANLPKSVATGMNLALQTKEPFTGPSEITIYTLDGKLVQRSSVEVYHGTATLKTPALPAGAYQIQLYGSAKNARNRQDDH